MVERERESERERQEMKRRSVDGEELVTRVEEEVWMQRAPRTEMVHALEA